MESEDDVSEDDTQDASVDALQRHIEDLHIALRSQNQIVQSLRDVIRTQEVSHAAAPDERELRIQEAEAYLLIQRQQTTRQRALALVQPDCYRAEYLELKQCLPLTHEDIRLSSWNTYDQRMSNKPVGNQQRVLWCARRQRCYHRQMLQRIGSRNRKVQFRLTTGRSWLVRNMYPKQVLQRCLSSEDVICSDTVLDGVEDELLDWHPPTEFEWDNKSLVVVLLDNLDLGMKVTHARHLTVDSVKKNTMHHSIVQARWLNDRSKLVGPPPTGSLYRGEYDLKTCLPTQNEAFDWLRPTWNRCIATTQAHPGEMRLLLRPPASDDRQKSGETVIVSLPIMTDKQASCKVDVAEAVVMTLNRYPEAKAVVFIFDFQTFIIFHWLKSTMREALRRAYALGGGFHRSIASVDGFNRLFSATVIEPAAIMLHRKDVKINFNAKDYNTVEQFQRMLAVAVLEWLVEVSGIPPAILQDAQKLLKSVEKNLEAKELIGFLAYGGTFLIQDRVAVQTADSEKLDSAWTYNTMIARACGKTNYAKAGVIMARNLNDGHRWIKDWRDDTPTFRESDSKCVGRHMDIGIEREVWHHKEPVTLASASKLANVNKAQTAKRYARKEYTRYCGAQKYKHRKKAVVVDEDIQILKETMLAMVGSTFAQLCKKKTYSDWAARGFEEKDLGTTKLDKAWQNSQAWLEKLITSPSDDPMDAEFYDPPEVVDLTLDDDDLDDCDTEPPTDHHKNQKWYDCAAINWCKAHIIPGEEPDLRLDRVKTLMSRNKERHRKLWEARSEKEALAEDREAEAAVKAVARAEKAAEKEYVVELIRGRRVVDDELQYRVQFEGYDPKKHNKWLPAEDLESCAALIARFEKQYNRPRNKGPGKRKDVPTKHSNPPRKKKKK